jgi:bifunctional non-homologous end joining protein LigD
VLATIQAHGLEGIVAKRKGSLYEPGERSGTWVKFKCGIKESFVIGGYIPVRSTGVDVGALLVGRHDEDGSYSSQEGLAVASRTNHTPTSRMLRPIAPG